MIQSRLTSRALAAIALTLGSLAAFAISPEELRRELSEGKPATIIDVRTGQLFKDGHIPNAINIPASLCPQKTLPRLGRVIVYGDGFGDAEKQALEALNAKPGINAELLEGGYSGWQAAQGTTTGDRGLSPEKLPYVTYQQVQETTSDVVLVDLRKQPEKKLSAASVNAPAQAAAPTALTDLAAAFPGKRVTKSAHKDPKQMSAKSVGVPQPIMVLIDNGDGTAQETARELRAQGNQRVVILAGGETAVARQGQRGLQRTGQNLENFNRAIRGSSN
ncbi:MAG TPA: rhodanese-like domain-containing protein [Verrucomicrobiae bacterium]